MTTTTKEFSTVKIKTDFCFINENDLFICHRIMNNTEPSLPAQCVLTLWGCVTGLFKYICFFSSHISPILMWLNVSLTDWKFPIWQKTNN